VQRPRTQQNPAPRQRQTQQHRPTTQLRVTARTTCGSCHGCQASSTPVAKGPHTVPMPVQRPGAPIPTPWRPQRPGFAPVVRLGPGPGLPIFRPVPQVPTVTARPGDLSRRREVTAVPVMRPPQRDEG
jgi:hypothetical protein